ncbi:2,3-bisphosphoglycerate-independent phosphoglycerate mutase [Ketogulonicigenium vulgare]|uniref:2,3-bisphosphoglycerate-independent phosphoglycerate mutase n=1 Tax=Ketogulonicigenium vulgare (strain WSH-001) TaxID=759362 RepID=F9Y5P0_KETVW|nr:2,3-bisphosphoglycerate-independent phosphoglycerate mutase [Ketogulonicigenium vulgare]ADO43696.1 2,3-bisphosphoglycerate-independent phosphoglycerate mutase [Ketogulonicigenium vulgare Y25]AEM41965.1 Phosphoglycerate mutase, 2,3-bisphosphoglycerate-independent [Ketogulonicigenium vulgare WSH-001]ALJ82425.1 2,3-bisphosphoglycerate-independent phosphoglycerate mutase [Ketogulonicigenium vulgare]ANW35209.1 phosphoglycerate mutase (2,3-diphosphoglycerate-independent) [Ketogulonicigenium vulgar
MTRPKPVVLCILDGWGIGINPAGDATLQADIPNFKAVMASNPHATLITFGPDVGLPTGQMGNSEVGHTNIGAGRVVAMDLGQIDLAIETGDLAQNAALQGFISALKTSGGAAHLLGVISDGGVHGHINHVLAAARIITGAGVPVVLHAITDGRDVAPDSAPAFMQQLVDHLPAGAKVGTVIGRYFALDRDNRWERVQTAYDAIARGHAQHGAPDAVTAVTQSHAAGALDEFVPATIIGDYAGLAPGDGLFCLNFRADRAREILACFADPKFAGFDRGPLPPLVALLGMVEYSSQLNAWLATVFPKRKLVNTLGEWVAAQGLTQFRLAETEKYPHVTFFLNGGVETPYPGEERHMPPSPKVATYDLQPEMSAAEVTDTFVAAIEKGYDLIVTNYANPDMVGHTGSIPATVKALEAVDKGLGRVLAALEQAGGAMLLTADHGNAEQMIDPATGGPHTAHTVNLVPVALIGGPGGATLRDGRLADVAPTILDLMGLPQPPEMTGQSLIRR